MELEVALRQLDPALRAWGAFVVARVQEFVELEIGVDRAQTFFKIPPNFRVKDTPSALTKQCKKQYDEPLEKMTDLVGARFVVLLKTDLDIVERAVITCTSWSKSKDRNPQDERDKNPNSFEYQSVHYVVRNNQAFRSNGVTVPEGLACEIQIRTLLQHAYAELVHDKFYKAQATLPLSALRLIARSMALMETTDEMFVTAVNELQRVNQDLASWCRFLDGTVGPLLPGFTPTSEDEDAMEVLSTFKFLLDAANIEEVRAILTQPIITRIQQRAAGGGLFSKPVVLAIYWLALHNAIELSAAWPIPSLLADLDLIKAHVGAA